MSSLPKPPKCTLFIGHLPPLHARAAALDHTFRPRWRVGVAAVVLAQLLACATWAPRAQQPPQPGTFHTVRPGDTVHGLARATGLTVEEIVEVNGLSSPRAIQVGQVLFLPAVVGRARGPEPRTQDGAAPVVPAPPATLAADAADATGVLAWPVDGVVLRAFSSGRSPYDGLLIAAPEGRPVLAAAAGEVLFAGDQGTAFGLVVVLRHDDDLVTISGHLSKATVQAGERVRPGQTIGYVGVTGGQESPRLHFQVRRGRTAVDPLPLLPPG